MTTVALCGGPIVVTHSFNEKIRYDTRRVAEKRTKLQSETWKTEVQEAQLSPRDRAMRRVS